MDQIYFVNGNNIEEIDALISKLNSIKNHYVVKSENDLIDLFSILLSYIKSKNIEYELGEQKIKGECMFCNECFFHDTLKVLKNRLLHHLASHKYNLKKESAEKSKVVRLKIKGKLVNLKINNSNGNYYTGTILNIDAILPFMIKEGPFKVIFLKKEEKKVETLTYYI